MQKQETTSTIKGNRKAGGCGVRQPGLRTSSARKTRNAGLREKLREGKLTRKQQRRLNRILASENSLKSLQVKTDRKKEERRANEKAREFRANAQTKLEELGVKQNSNGVWMWNNGRFISKKEVQSLKLNELMENA